MNGEGTSKNLSQLLTSSSEFIGHGLKSELAGFMTLVFPRGTRKNNGNRKGYLQLFIKLKKLSHLYIAYFTLPSIGLRRVLKRGQKFLNFLPELTIKQQSIKKKFHKVTEE